MQFKLTAGNGMTLATL